MEVLSRKKVSRRGSALRVALIVLICLANLAVIAFLIRRQVQLENYSREAAPQPGDIVVAKLVEKTGKVVVRRKGALDYKAVSKGDALYRGDIVQTTENAKATFLFGEKTRLSLMQNSLLVIQELPGSGAKKAGTVLQIEHGSVSIESDEEVEEIVALKTPNSVIKLNVRTTEFYFPDDEEKLAFARPKAKAGLMHGYNYLKYLQKKYVPLFEGDDDPELVGLAALLEKTESVCAKGLADACFDMQDSAWKEISRLRGYNTQDEKVVLTASVDEKGIEKINVEQGVVKVETETRLFAVTEGEKIELEPGKTSTRPLVTDEAREIVVAGKPAEVFFVEVDTFYWE